MTGLGNVELTSKRRHMGTARDYSTIGQPGWYACFPLPTQGEPGYATRTTDSIATANGVFGAVSAVGALLMMWSCYTYGRKRNIQVDLMNRS